MKKLRAIFLLAIMICGVLFVSSLHFSTAQAYTPVNGQITSDTTWTKADSPYTLTGFVQVRSGVTLTIQPGVTVNLGTSNIEVNGTLVAVGTDTDQILINGTYKPRAPVAFSENTNPFIMFMSGSNGLNEQTGSGSIIKNAKVMSTTLWVTNSSPRISDNSFSGYMAFESIRLQGGASSIYSNSFTDGTITVSAGSPTIYGNTLTNNGYGTAISVTGGNPVIVSNGLSQFYGGISCAGSPDSIISDNSVSNCYTAITVDGAGTIVERNVVSDNQVGISAGNAIVRHNTIKNNDVGAYLTSATTFNYNNLENNKNNTLCTGSNDVNATYNWWGTTDQSAISNSIYDNKNDFNLGKINFIPFLTAPDPQAMPNENVPIPTPNTAPSPSPGNGTYWITDQYGNTIEVTPNPSTSPTQNPTATPQQSTTQSGTLFGLDSDKIIIIMLGIIIALLIVVIAVMRRRSAK